MRNTRYTQPAPRPGDGLGAALTGRRVAAVSGGGRLELTLDGPVTVRVVHEFRFAGPAEVEHFYPELTFRPTGPLLALVGRKVGSARVTMAGGLELVFDGEGSSDDAASLSVPPHARLAPWSVFTPRGPVCAGLPGGEVVWPEPGGEPG
ncbi:DUF6188 family protein [Kitasatospora sp. NPDC093806]|uniref:DUF6188 family protein n=1 Tax=Kitasatospora sp. NPDC093806 TaxID=3155075 RepID=UPI00341A3EF8